MKDYIDTKYGSYSVKTDIVPIKEIRKMLKNKWKNLKDSNGVILIRADKNNNITVTWSHLSGKISLTGMLEEVKRQLWEMQTTRRVAQGIEGRMAK